MRSVAYYTTKVRMIIDMAKCDGGIVGLGSDFGNIIAYLCTTNPATMPITDHNQTLLDTIAASSFSAAGVAGVDILNDERTHLHSWLEAGMHGDMRYMERSAELRHDPRNVFKDAQTVIVTLTKIARVAPHKPTIAAFAHNFCDYHIDIKNRLHNLLTALQAIDPLIKGRAVVDSAPIFEKAWAVRAGLGWIGRNSLLINPTHGSSTLIGVLLINKLIETTPTLVQNGCPDGCSQCRDACPNGAINDNRTIDARRCISYATLETLVPSCATHGHILGCDRCADACPYNAKATTIEPIYDVDWASISDEEFTARFGKSSLARVGLDRIRALICRD